MLVIWYLESIMKSLHSQKGWVPFQRPLLRQCRELWPTRRRPMVQLYSASAPTVNTVVVTSIPESSPATGAAHVISNIKLITISYDSIVNFNTRYTKRRVLAYDWLTNSLIENGELLNALVIQWIWLRSERTFAEGGGATPWAVLLTQTTFKSIEFVVFVTFVLRVRTQMGGVVGQTHRAVHRLFRRTTVHIFKFEQKKINEQTIVSYSLCPFCVK